MFKVLVPRVSYEHFCSAKCHGVIAKCFYSSTINHRKLIQLILFMLIHVYFDASFKLYRVNYVLICFIGSKTPQ